MNTPRPAVHSLPTDSIARVQLLAEGGYSLYAASGELIGATPHAIAACDITSAALRILAGQGLYLQPSITLNTATAMAHLEQALATCRAADQDYERTGAVSAATVADIRTLLAARGAA